MAQQRDSSRLKTYGELAGLIMRSSVSFIKKIDRLFEDPKVGGTKDQKNNVFRDLLKLMLFVCTIELVPLNTKISKLGRCSLLALHANRGLACRASK